VVSFCVHAQTAIWQAPPPLPPTTTITKPEYVHFFARVFKCMHHPLNAEMDIRLFNAVPGKKQKRLRAFKAAPFELDDIMKSMLEVCVARIAGKCPRDDCFACDGFSWIGKRIRVDDTQCTMARFMTQFLRLQASSLLRPVIRRRLRHTCIDRLFVCQIFGQATTLYSRTFISSPCCGCA
jgi:hypothetical protein